MALSISRRKEKAKELQRWACEKISGITGFEWGVSGEDKPIESRAMSQPGTDIRLEKEVLAVFPYSIECKRQESWSVPEWIRQASKNQIKDTDWVLIIKRSRQNPVVVIDAEVFFKLIKKKMRRK